MFRQNKKAAVLASLGGFLILSIGTIFAAYVVERETNFFSRTFASGTAVKTLDIAGRNAMANEINGVVSPKRDWWVGTGSSSHPSYTGMVFTVLSVPEGDWSVESAFIEVYSRNNASNPLDVTIYYDTDTTPALFYGRNSVKISERSLSSTSVTYSTAEPWQKRKKYQIDVTDLVNAYLAENPNPVPTHMAFIMRGNGSSESRRFIFGPANTRSPELVINFNVEEPGGDTSGGTTGGDTSGGTTSGTTGHGDTSGGTTGGTGTVEGRPTAYAYGLWDQWTHSGTGVPAYTQCTKAEHDQFYVIAGPEGKVYPTWHPAELTRADGTKCSFGHEHGRDPSKSALWEMVKEHYAYDANGNGTIEQSEKDKSGLPFGFVNEALDAANLGFHRHESHEGHKVDYANGEGDMPAGDRFGSSLTGGVVVPYTTGGTPKWRDSGVRCYYLAKPHQGLSSPDAFSNNLHEVLYFAKCWNVNGNAADEQEVAISIMQPFGKVGEFTTLCDANPTKPPNDPTNVEDRTTKITTGTTSANQNYPGTRNDGERLIVTRECVERQMLVPTTGSVFSNIIYEVWPAPLRITDPQGNDILWRVNLQFDATETGRYFDPSKANKMSYSMDLCYENLNGRKMRSIQCDYSTNYGAIQGIKWDDPRSGFRGINRGLYVMPPILQNAGGSNIMYSDVFGKNAKSTYTAGSIKQRISAKNVEYSGGNVDHRIIQRVHSTGSMDMIHLPN